MILNYSVVFVVRARRVGAKPHDLERREKGDLLQWGDRSKRHAEDFFCVLFFLEPGEAGGAGAGSFVKREREDKEGGCTSPPGTGANGLDKRIFDPIRFFIFLYEFF